ncbi:uncharacterized protein LOC117169820 [Belonocnema kinseyi]|uniref:uncharacterized protein LOC117169820 n=1 Tax=Belonocnema kinseyi TaxID=2817044 RepID=UPI00143D4CA7|nr:uncharacterized protein LOC117169820 [Belonocnema kinseyi]
MIRLIQEEGFPDELKSLKSKGHLNGNLNNLAPFIDSDGIMRVGGRIDKSNLSFSQKHPALLPHHYFTDVLIREEHIKSMHGGIQTTFNILHQNFWVTSGRNTVKRVIYKCVTCARINPSIPQYIMGDLPKSRLSLERPFLVCGIDYCGPFYIKERRHRNRNKIKTFAAIFVCFATKAVHIELVSDLSTEAFMAALRRFFSRRGLSSDLYSDNATNIVGAKNEIVDIQNLLSSHEHNKSVERTLTNDNIAWHVIPPRSPHFGGLWEPAVRSFKHHLLRVVANTLLIHEDLLTLTTEIEAILNSRPLTPISSDPNDLSTLTPAHFLIGDSFRSMPERHLTEIPTARLSSWQRVQQMRQHFWSRWYKEYLHQLNVKKK